MKFEGRSHKRCVRALNRRQNASECRRITSLSRGILEADRVGRAFFTTVAVGGRHSSRAVIIITGHGAFVSTHCSGDGQSGKGERHDRRGKPLYPSTKYSLSIRTVLQAASLPIT